MLSTAVVPATGKVIPPTEPPLTARLRPVASVVPPDTTDYELSASAVFPQSKSSIALPPIRFVEPKSDETADIPKSTVSTLDPMTRRVFHQRLRLCCLIAVVPFVFFFACAVTNFIEPFGRETVGLTGAILAATVIAGLVATAVVLVREEPYDGNVLRAVELGVFGSMGLFFAYWQFMVLTSAPMKGFEGGRQHEQIFVFAITLITHLNWVALIVFHGVLVPNTLVRGAGVVGAMAALALLVDGIAVG